jgi:hypothetical protein
MSGHHSWKLLVCALVAVLAVAGCGGSGHGSTGPASRPSRPTSSRRTGAVATTPAITAGAVLKSFSGSGAQTIGSISETRATVIQWSATRPPLQLVLPNGFLLVSTEARAGRVRLLRGTYSGVRVMTKGRWTLELRSDP